MEEPNIGIDYIHVMAWYYTDASNFFKGQPSNNKDVGNVD